MIRQATCKHMSPAYYFDQYDKYYYDQYHENQHEDNQCYGKFPVYWQPV